MKRIAKILCVLLTMLMLASLFAACANDNNTIGGGAVTGAAGTTGDNKAAENNPPVTPDTDDETDAPYMTVTDSYGREVIIEKQPVRIVSAAPNITETIYALGKSDLLVGRTDWCNYPADAFDIAAIGNIDMPSIETVVALEPDLVIGSSILAKEAVEAMEAAGLTVVLFRAEESFEGTYEFIRNVAIVIGADSEAEAIVKNMRDTVADIAARVEGREAPTVYYVMMYGEWGDWTATGETFINDMITMAGGVNSAADAEGWSYSLEKLVENDPDIIITTFYNADGLADANGYKDLTAVQEGRVYIVDEDALSRQGPRLADALLELARIFHPDAF